MSRIGKKPIVVPANVTVAIDSQVIRVKGPKGETTIALHPNVHVVNTDGSLSVSVDHPDLLPDRALWGTYGSLLKSAIKGVQEEYQKQLELVGVGFRAQLQGQTLTMNLGFSHPVIYLLPKGIAGSVEKNVITVKGISKELVGETAACIRALKKPEPYQGKGIKYVGEVIRRKAGKAVKAAGAA